MPIQWPGKIVMPMGGADAEDFAKRWEETFGRKGTNSERREQLLALRQELHLLREEIEACSFGDRPQSPSVEALRRERALIEAIGDLERADG